MQTWFNNQCYIDETDQVFLAWEAVRGEEPLSVWHDLTFLLRMKIKRIIALTNHIIREPIPKTLILKCFKSKVSLLLIRLLTLSMTHATLKAIVYSLSQNKVKSLRTTCI